jgi:ADP-heptose:LPS heptosyltransferase
MAATKPAPSGRELLVIRLSSLGDVVLTLPALEVLRRREPEAHIVFLTKAVYAPLASAFPAVDEVMSLPDDAGIAATLRLAALLRRRPLAAVYDLHGSLRSRLLAAFAGSRKIWRVRSRAATRRALVVRATVRRWLDRNPPPKAAGSDRPLVALAAARAIDPRLVPADLPPARLDLPETCIAWARSRLAGLQRPWVALCPGSRHATKRWPGFKELAALLIARGTGVIVVLGAEDTFDAPGSCPVVRPPLLEIASLLSQCDGVVGNDSGLAHVAAAAGTPVVVVFGSTVPAFGFRPPAPHRVVERLELGCRPCAVHGRRSCPRGDLACLAPIGPEEVLAALDDLLGSAAPPAAAAFTRPVRESR